MTQAQALDIMKTGANVFLTGEPGSGKTHTVNAYIRYLSERKITASVTASTGIAATHVNGMTIHSWSGIGIRKRITEGDLELLSENERLVRRLVGAKVLVIDEISMLEADVLESVDSVCRALRRRQEPFGGIQVIFVGDFFQLPPVVKGGETARFAYHAKAWEEAKPIVCYITEQHRQEDDVFLDILAKIRRGEQDELMVELLQARSVAKEPEHGTTRLHSHNVDVDKQNAAKLGGLDGEPEVFQMKESGNDRFIEALKKQCISPERLVLKEGATVMFTKNDFDRGFVNGTLGVVTGFDANDGFPLVRTKHGKTIKAEPMDWSIEDGKKILAKITQVPLRLAWAITIHKSQGMSLDSAAIDLSQAFEYGQGYVALSRVRSLEGLLLLGLNQRALEVHPEILEDDMRLRAESEQAARLFDAMGREELAKLQQNFLRAMGGLVTMLKPVTGIAVGKHERPAHPLRTMEERRAKHPNAYKSWSQDDDKRLTELYGKGVTRPELAKKFGRNGGAIRARLVHLGLLEQ